MDNLLLWLDAGNHPGVVSALGTVLSAFVALLALAASLIAIIINRRIARYASEPWLEVEPRKVRVDIEWDLNHGLGVEAKGNTPGEHPRHLWGGAYKTPSWQLVNVGNGPALNITAHWHIDRLLLEKALGSCGHVFNKDLGHDGNTVRDLDSGMPLILCRWDDRAAIGFRAAAPAGMGKVEPEVIEEDALAISNGNFGGAVLHALSFADTTSETGEFAQGTIDLTLEYTDRFRRKRTRAFQFEYEGIPFRDVRDGKKIVTAILEIEPRPTPQTAPIMQRYLGRDLSYWLRARALLFSLWHKKRQAKRVLRRSLNLFKKITKRSDPSS